MNGFEVCGHLKADHQLKGIPVIFISALTEQLDKVKAFAIGGVDYLTKPFQMEELHARVETHLKLRRLQVELEESNSRLERVNVRMSRDLEAAAKIQKTFLPSRRTSHPGHRVRLVLPAVRRTGRRRAEHRPARRWQGWPLHSGCQRPWRLVGPAVGDAQPSPLAAVGALLDSDPGSKRSRLSRSHAARGGRRSPEPALSLRHGDRAIRDADVWSPGRFDAAISATSPQGIPARFIFPSAGLR